MTLSSQYPAIASVPASVTVLAGATFANFTITTNRVTANTTVSITGGHGATRMATLTVRPWLLSLTLSPTSVVGGVGSSTGTVRLNAAAPVGGIYVSLSSLNPAAASTPASVIVASGSTSSTFPVTTYRVAANTNVTIASAYDGVTRSAVLTVQRCNVGTPAPPSSFPPDTVWFDDQLPAGAVPSGTWTWDTTQKASGSASNTEPAVAGAHTHSFINATQSLPVGIGDVLVAYVLLSPCDPPREIMLQWYGTGGWDHRAFWGEDLQLSGGGPGTYSRFPMGPLPPTGVWTRLEVPASLVAMEGLTATGMAFSVYDGQAWFDRAGKAACVVSSAPPPGSFPPETVWMDDQLPAGASASGNWIWDTAQKASGTQSSSHPPSVTTNQHSFTTSASFGSAASSDVLVCYVLLSPCQPPKEIELVWNVGGNWIYGAFWGPDIIDATNGPVSSRRFPMGPLPPAGQWVRLTVPATAVDLAGRQISGMMFRTYGGKAWFDRAGKAPANYSNLAVLQSALQLNSTIGETVSYTSHLPVAVTETLTIKNSAGQTVRTLVNTARSPGVYTDVWNGRNDQGAVLPDGPYFYTVTATSGAQSAIWDLSNQFVSDFEFFDSILYDPQSPFMPYNNLPLQLSYNLAVNQLQTPAGPGRVWILFTPYGSILDEAGPYPDLSLCSRPPHFCVPAGEYQESGLHAYSWPGVDPLGVFRRDIRAIGVLANRKTFPRNAIVLHGTKPVISNLSLTPPAHAPAVAEQEISFDLATYQSQSVTATLTSLNQSSRSVLRTLIVTGVAPGRPIIRWDGRADNGMWVAPGAYVITLKVVDGLGNQVSTQAVTTVKY